MHFRQRPSLDCEHICTGAQEQGNCANAYDNMQIYANTSAPYVFPKPLPNLHCLQYVNSLGGICRGLGSLVPRPHPREKRVWWHSADSLGFVKNSSLAVCIVENWQVIYTPKKCCVVVLKSPRISSVALYRLCFLQHDWQREFLFRK